MNRVVKYLLIGVAAWATLFVLGSSQKSPIVAVLPLADGSKLVLSSAHAQLCRDAHAAFIDDGTAFGDEGCWERSYGNVIVRWSEGGERSPDDALGDANIYSQQDSWIYDDSSELLTGFDRTQIDDWNRYEIARFLGPVALMCWGVWIGWLIFKRKEDGE